MSREEIALPDGLRKEDAQARVLAQREFERPVVVEAGAGTGKTTALVARVLAWSFGPGWDRAKAIAASTAEGARDDRIAAQVLRGVVAITFTEKAAAEMSERIGDALLEVEHGKSLEWLEDPVPTLSADELCERARALRGSLDYLVVQTIHAYCRRLLVENSLDARLHPNLEIDADGRLQEQAVRSAMEAALESAYASPGDPG
ncbi:MAG: UvrD-helicase domain-containing protein, partial [Myxococcota bacterium]